MSTVAFYRTCLWLPLAVPAVVIAVRTTLGLSLAEGMVGEVLSYSLVYGGVPYAGLALWATWWIGGRSEPEIRRLMLRAPLLMAAVFVTLTMAVGLIVRAPVPFAGLALLGAAVILPLGYAYVGLTALLSRGLDRL